MTVEEMATFKGDVSTLGLLGPLGYSKLDQRSNSGRAVNASERCRVF